VKERGILTEQSLAFSQAWSILEEEPEIPAIRPAINQSLARQPAGLIDWWMDG
jgi:hypothetical protein